MRWNKAQKAPKHLRELVGLKRRSLKPRDCMVCGDTVWFEPIRFVWTSFHTQDFYCFACCFTVDDVCKQHVARHGTGFAAGQYVCKRVRFHTEYYTVDANFAIELRWSL